MGLFNNKGILPGEDGLMGMSLEDLMRAQKWQRASGELGRLSGALLMMGQGYPREGTALLAQGPQQVDPFQQASQMMQLKLAQDQIQQRQQQNEMWGGLFGDTAMESPAASGPGSPTYAALEAGGGPTRAAAAQLASPSGGLMGETAPAKGLFGDITPQQARILQAMGPEAGMSVLAQLMFRDPKERKTIQGADGFQYYVDTGERVLPGVKKAEQLPAGMRMGEAGPEWIPGYLEGRKSVAASGAPKIDTRVIPPPGPGQRWNKDHTALEPIPGYRSPADEKEYKKAINTVGGVEDALANYRALLEEGGPALAPGPRKTKLAAAHRALQLLLKQDAMFNLGVLNGPDLALLDEVVNDPTTLGANFSDLVGMDRLMPQLDQLQSMLQGVRQRTEELYGSPKAPGKTSFDFSSMDDDAFLNVDIGSMDAEQLKAWLAEMDRRGIGSGR